MYRLLYNKKENLKINKNHYVLKMLIIFEKICICPLHLNNNKRVPKFTQSSMYIERVPIIYI